MAGDDKKAAPKAAAKEKAPPKAEAKADVKTESKADAKVDAKPQGKSEAAAPPSYSRGEGQKPVSQAYKDNWNVIFGQKSSGKAAKRNKKKKW